MRGATTLRPKLFGELMRKRPRGGPSRRSRISSTASMIRSTPVWHRAKNSSPSWVSVVLRVVRRNSRTFSWASSLWKLPTHCGTPEIEPVGGARETSFCRYGDESDHARIGGGEGRSEGVGPCTERRGRGTGHGRQCRTGCPIENDARSQHRVRVQGQGDWRDAGRGGSCCPQMESRVRVDTPANASSIARWYRRYQGRIGCCSGRLRSDA